MDGVGSEPPLTTVVAMRGQAMPQLPFTCPGALKRHPVGAKSARGGPDGCPDSHRFPDSPGPTGAAPADAAAERLGPRSLVTPRCGGAGQPSPDGWCEIGWIERVSQLTARAPRYPVWWHVDTGEVRRTVDKGLAAERSPRDPG